MPNDGASGKERRQEVEKHLAPEPGSRRCRRRHLRFSSATGVILVLAPTPLYRNSPPPISTLHLSRPPPTYPPTTPSCNSFRINPRFSNAPRCFPARIYPPPYLPTSLPPARGMPRRRVDRVLSDLSLYLPFTLSPFLSFPTTSRSTVLPLSLSLFHRGRGGTGG